MAVIHFFIMDVIKKIDSLIIFTYFLKHKKHPQVLSL